MHNNKKWTFKKIILSKIVEIGHGTLDAFFPAKYPEARLWRKLLGLDPSHAFLRRNISLIISQLKNQGLVHRLNQSPKLAAQWEVTPAGLRYLRSRGMYNFAPEADAVTRIIIFDIPEKERKKRDWLRTQLRYLAFEQLQKSVWIGNRSVPEEFIADLEFLGLRNRIHIFSVNKRGTLPDKRA